MATKCCEISTVDLSYVVPVKSKVEILQYFVAFSEYMNFINYFSYSPHILRKPQMIEKNLPLFLNWLSNAIENRKKISNFCSLFRIYELSCTFLKG